MPSRHTQRAFRAMFSLARRSTQKAKDFRPNNIVWKTFLEQAKINGERPKNRQLKELWSVLSAEAKAEVVEFLLYLKIEIPSCMLSGLNLDTIKQVTKRISDDRIQETMTSKVAEGGWKDVLDTRDNKKHSTSDDGVREDLASEQLVRADIEEENDVTTDLEDPRVREDMSGTCGEGSVDIAPRTPIKKLHFLRDRSSIGSPRRICEDYWVKDSKERQVRKHAKSLKTSTKDEVLTDGTQVSKLKNTLFKDVVFKNTWDPCAHCENMSHLLKSNKLSNNTLLSGVKYGKGISYIDASIFEHVKEFCEKTSIVAIITSPPYGKEAKGWNIVLNLVELWRLGLVKVVALKLLNSMTEPSASRVVFWKTHPCKKIMLPHQKYSNFSRPISRGEVWVVWGLGNKGKNLFY